MATANMNYLMTDEMVDIYREGAKDSPADDWSLPIRQLCAHSDAQNELISRNEADAARWRKVLGLLAVAGPSRDGIHVWQFKPLVGPHANLNDAVDHLGET